MIMKKSLLAAAALGMVSAPSAAQAATLLFDFDGDDGREFTFTLDSDRAPDSGSSFGSNTTITFRDVMGTFIDPDGTDAFANISFGTGFFSTLQVGAINFSPNTFRGPDLFDGSRNNPQFNVGSFELSGSVLNDTSGILNVSEIAAVPEPATWAMMLLGFFAIGGAMRARRTVKVRSLTYS